MTHDELQNRILAAIYDDNLDKHLKTAMIAKVVDAFVTEKTRKRSHQMKINHTAFTKREAMIIRESLWEPLEKLIHYPKDAFLTNYLVQSNVTRAELKKTLEKLWDALPNKYEDELEANK